MEILATMMAVVFFVLGVEGGKAEERVKEKSVEEWAREGQCVPSKYWKGTWVCGKGKEFPPTLWFEKEEGK